MVVLICCCRLASLSPPFVFDGAELAAAVGVVTVLGTADWQPATDSKPHTAKPIRNRDRQVNPLGVG